MAFGERTSRVVLTARAMLTGLCLILALPAEAQPLIYGLSSSENLSTFPTSFRALVTVVDPATGDRASIPFGTVSSSPQEGLAIMPDGGRGYATDGSQVFVLDLSAFTVAGSFQAGTSPGRLALSADGSRLFVINRAASTIAVVSTSTHLVTHTISVPVSPQFGEQPLTMVPSPDGARLYVLASWIGAVYVVDLVTMAVEATVMVYAEIDARPQFLAIHPDGTRLYVAHGMFAHPLYPLRNLITVIDTRSLTVTHTREIPLVPGVPNGPTGSGLGQPTVLSDGSRLFVPQVMEGYRFSPTQFVHSERLVVLDPATLDTIAAPDPPLQVSGQGGLFAPVLAAGTGVFAIGPWSTASVDPVTGTMTPIGAGVGALQAALVAPRPPCAFVMQAQARYVRNNADTVTVQVPAPAGCAWTASTAADWLTLTPQGDEVGPGTIAVRAAQTAEPRSAVVSVGSRSVVIRQALAATVIDSPEATASLTPPLNLAGWAVDRADISPNAVLRGGVSTVELWDQPDPAAGVPRSLGSALAGFWRPDIAALFGPDYLNSGYSGRVGRLAAGRHRLEARATSRYDGTVTTASLDVMVERRPVLVQDLPAQGAHVTQPFRLWGWALDATAPSGTGVDAVQLWATRAGGVPALVGQVPYGIARGDIDTYMGVGNGFLNSGFEMMVAGLPSGSYTLTVTARYTATGTYEVSASAQVTIDPQAPIGAFDTPAGGAAVWGSIAVTGWALDDVAVDRVEIWRDRAPGETTPVYVGPGPGNGKIFIATPLFISGSRPDVEAAYGVYPAAARAGWGYLMLTQGLWNQGNGPFTLYAFAFDQDGRAATLGIRIITASNSTAVKPFGALDTPSYGQAVTTSFWNYGWALTPRPNAVDGRTCTIANGGVQMGIDSGPPVSVAYGDLRSDIAGAFPGFSNGTNAGGASYIDISTLTSGIHQIGWLVTDSCGRVDGIGSRFFTVPTGGP